MVTLSLENLYQNLFWIWSLQIDFIAVFDLNGFTLPISIWSQKFYSTKNQFIIWKKDPIESSLEIISCILSELTDDHFNTAARLLPNYARLALENRKNPAWQQSVDCIIRIISQIEKSNRNASKMYDSLESFFILLLSESSSRRIKILAAQAWEIKFKNENISLGKLILNPFTTHPRNLEWLW